MNSSNFLTEQFDPGHWPVKITWKTDRSDKIKRDSLQAVSVSILLNRYTTWTLTKRIEKRLDGNYTKMIRVILNISWKQHPMKQQLYNHLLPMSKTNQVKRTRHAGHYFRSKDELIRDILLWTPRHGSASVGWPARVYLHQLCTDTGCNLEYLPGAMDDRDG